MREAWVFIGPESSTQWGELEDEWIRMECTAPGEARLRIMDRYFDAVAHWCDSYLPQYVEGLEWDNRRKQCG